MPDTTNELNEFNDFAVKRLDGGNAESLEDLLLAWRDQQERAEVNAAIQRGLAEAEAGLIRPIDEFLDEFAERNNQRT